MRCLFLGVLIPSAPLLCNSRVFGEVARTLGRGASTPHMGYDKRKIESHKLEIQEILSALNAPDSPHSGSDRVSDCAPQSPSVSSHGTAMTSASKSGRSVIDLVWNVDCNPFFRDPKNPALGRLIKQEFVPDELPSLIEAVFACKDVGDTIRCLPRDDAQTFIDVIDEARHTPSLSRVLSLKSTFTTFFCQALDRPDLSPSARKRCLRPLYRTCGRHALLPRVSRIPICYDRTSIALYRGGYADVWKGEYCGRVVAVNVIRTYSNSDLQEIIGVSCRLCFLPAHPNVDHLLGRGSAKR